MWTVYGRPQRGRGDFFVDVINGWLLTRSLEERSDRLPRADRLPLGGWCKTKLAPPDQRNESTQCAVGQEANAEHQLYLMNWGHTGRVSPIIDKRPGFHKLLSP